MRVDNFNRKKLWEGCILTTIAHALQYVLEDEIFSKEKYQGVEEDGAYIIENHIKRFDENMQGLIEYYDISDELVNMIESIYSRKMINPDRIIPLLENEKNLLLKTYESNPDESKQSLKEINIYFTTALL